MLYMENIITKIKNKQITIKNYKYHLTNDEINYIINYFKDSTSINESFYRIINNIIERPKCIICGGQTKFYGGSKGFSKTCCSKCARLLQNKTMFGNNEEYKKDFYKNIQNKIKKTCLEKYGVDSPNKVETIKNKKKNSYIKKYGVDNPMKNKNIHKKAQKTLYKKYGVEFPYQSEEIINKYKTTCLERYGVDHNFKIKECHIKSQQTCFKKYGVKFGWNNEQQKQTCLEKYGVDNVAKSEIIKEKIQKTCYDKYNCKSPLSSDLIKYKNISKKECIEKQILSMYKNGTLSSSTPENESYKLLKEKYSDVIHHYKDKNRYPFNCDFYIPSLDLFIECQYGMFHSKRPYVGNEIDLNEIEILNEKSQKRKQKTGKLTSRYDSLIYTWSIADPLKRNIAKQNNLNFIEFWNINELIDWINKYN